MHIPDGYLSPSTCAVLYGGALPFWYASLRKMKQLAGTRMIPLVSVFAAFSFVIMMFNLPLPGGTTGHAVGIGLAAIVLGPSGAMVAVSIALTIQALLFGDGGITALGANCFNMGIVGSLVAYLVYRILAGRSPLTSTRRVIAAGAAGYAAINASALLAAVEFGIQPMLFHDAAGVPLYCPYPLSISVPAMMLGHLTLAGLAELTISAGVVRYLQTSDVTLLQFTAPGISLPSGTVLPSRGGFGVPKKLWVALAVLLILTPLGIIAAGSAWGEWTAQDFADPKIRAEIAASSGYRPPPVHAPRGLERLSTLWTAPIARYAPQFVGNASLGYLMSGLVGVGAILLATLLLNWLARKLPVRRTSQRGFVERTVASLMRVVEESLFAEAIARGPGFMQRFDSRTKVASLFLLILAAASVRNLIALLALFLLAVAMAVLSHISLKLLIVRAWLPALAFSGVLAIPALFLTPGKEIWRLPLVDISLTDAGVKTAAFLLGRVLTATTLSLLLVLTTEWSRVLRALRFFHVPVPVVVILGMTYRYLFVLLKTAHDMFESRRTRLVGVLEEAERQRLASASTGILLEKSVALSQEIHLAMLARGFRGEVFLLEDPPINAVAWLQLSGFAVIALATVLVAR
jgi:cobalt/nickel transport system permease protein